MNTAIPVEAPASPSPVGLRQLAGIVAPWRWALLAVALGVFLGAAAELAPPLLVRRIVDDCLARRRSDGLLLLALFYLAAVGCANILGFLTGYLTAYAAQGALHDLRVKLFAHLLRLPAGYHDQNPVGDSISRCTNDVETLSTLFSAGVTNVVADLVRLVAVLGAMVVMSPALTAVALAVILPAFVTARFFQLKVRRAERDTRQAVGVLNTHLQETLAGAEVIRAFGRQSAFVQRFREALRAMLRVSNRSMFYSSLYTPTMALLASLATASLLWAGAAKLPAGWGVSIGTLTAFILLFQRFTRPITALGDEWQTVQAAVAGAERIFQVLAVAADAPGRPQGQAASDDCPRSNDALVSIENVSFGYAPDRPVLRNVAVRVRSGEHLVIVGPSGAGKTTLAHLVCGLYSPWSGALRVAGIDPRALSDRRRRTVIGIVPQTVQLFSGTIWNNLTLGDATATEQAVRTALRLTGLDELIAGLPLACNTPIRGGGRSGGLQLSAGQRQLLALARALVTQPRVLVMDEASSAIDSVSEARLRAALRRALQQTGCCVITVAHRLAVARDADRVLVMEDGVIVEDGPPDELIARGGVLAGLLELEAAGWDWDGARDNGAR